MNKIFIDQKQKKKKKKFYFFFFFKKKGKGILHIAYSPKVIDKYPVDGFPDPVSMV